MPSSGRAGKNPGPNRPRQPFQLFGHRHLLRRIQVGDELLQRRQRHRCALPIAPQLRGKRRCDCQFLDTTKVFHVHQDSNTRANFHAAIIAGGVGHWLSM
jgi:hypothetical protein